MTEGEAKTKHFLVLDVRPGRDGKSEFRAIKRAFKNVRPFIYRDVSLSELIGDGPRNESAVKDGLSKYLERLLAESQPETQRPHHPEMAIPLIRLRIEHTGFHTINPQQFGHHFVGRVANHQDLLCFYKKRAFRAASAPAAAAAAAEDDEMAAINLAMRGESVKIHDIVAQILKETQTSMRILGQDVLQQALVDFAEKEDRTAIEAAVSGALGKVRKHVIAECQQGRQLAFIDDPDKVDKAIERLGGSNLRPPPLDSGVAARPLVAQALDDDDAPIVLVPENGRGVQASQRGGRGAARGGRGGGAAAAADRQSKPAKKAARTTLLGQTQSSAVNVDDGDSAGSDDGRAQPAPTQNAGLLARYGPAPAMSSCAFLFSGRFQASSPVRQPSSFRLIPSLCCRCHPQRPQLWRLANARSHTSSTRHPQRIWQLNALVRRQPGGQRRGVSGSSAAPAQAAVCEAVGGRWCSRRPTLLRKCRRPCACEMFLRHLFYSFITYLRQRQHRENCFTRITTLSLRVRISACVSCRCHLPQHHASAQQHTNNTRHISAATHIQHAGRSPECSEAASSDSNGCDSCCFLAGCAVEGRTWLRSAAGCRGRAAAASVRGVEETRGVVLAEGGLVCCGCRSLGAAAAAASIARAFEEGTRGRRMMGSTPRM